MPRDLVAKMDEAEQNAEYHSVRSNLKYLDASIRERMEKRYEGESSELWSLSKAALRQFKRAFAALLAAKPGSEEWNKKQAAAKAKLEHLTEMLTRGETIYHLFEHLQPLLEQQRKTAESNAKIEKDLGEILTVTQAKNFLAAIAATCKKHLKEEDYEAFRVDLRKIRQH